MPIDRSVGNYFDHSGSFIRRVARWTGPNPYATGGEVATPATFGLGIIVAFLLSEGTNAAGSGTMTPVWNATTQKLQWFTAAGAEVTGGTDLSGYSAGFEVIGQ